MAATGDNPAINATDMTRRDSMAILLWSVHPLRDRGAHCYARPCHGRTSRNLEERQPPEGQPTGQAETQNGALAAAA
jgi:hypothetical protein